MTFRGSKKTVFHWFFIIFSTFFPYIWHLTGPKFAEKGWPLLGEAKLCWPLLGKAKLSSRDQVGC